MKKYVISEILADAILSYLSYQPYREVYDLIRQIKEMSELPEGNQEDGDTSS